MSVAVDRLIATATTRWATHRQPKTPEQKQPGKDRSLKIALDRFIDKGRKSATFGTARKNRFRRKTQTGSFRGNGPPRSFSIGKLS